MITKQYIDFEKKSCQICEKLFHSSQKSHFVAMYQLKLLALAKSFTHVEFVVTDLVKSKLKACI